MLALLPTVLWLRWGPASGNWGEQLTPLPDAVEYVAGAQSLAETGRYFLQLGPWQVQPRYPPGLSLLIAPAVRLGIGGDQLWRVAALFEWGVVVILALGARALVLRLVPGARWTALLAGLGAAATWLLSPLLSTQGSFVVSDQPTLLVVLLGGLAAAYGVTAKRGGAAWALAGFATGLAATMRAVEGPFLVIALLPLALETLRRSTARRTLRLAALYCLGAVLPLLLAAGVIHRSGFPATRWSTYSYWESGTFYSLDHTFSLHNAVEGGVPILDGEGVRRRIPHAVFVAQVLAGWPGLFVFDYLGYFWPALALASALWLASRLRATTPGAGPYLLSAALWTLLHVVLAAIFVWPVSRLLLAAFALSTVAYWTAIGVAWTGGRGPRALSTAAATLALAGGLWLTVDRVRVSPPYEEVNRATRQAFATWIAKQPDIARERVPFDSVRAQALGLLNRENLARIRSWGPLGESWHFSVLHANGYVCFQRGYGWYLDATLRPAEAPGGADRAGAER